MRQGNTQPGGEVALFEAPDGQIRLDVRLQRDTVWLTQAQMAELFGRERSVITKHINNIFKERELDESNVQYLHIAGSDKPVGFFNLDVIISVGYRVKSLRGTQFRIWATRVLREHLVQGYTFNQTRLAERGLLEARQTLNLLARTLQNQALVDDTGRAVLDLIIGYADTWRLLLEYDEDRLASPPGARPSKGVLEYTRGTSAIADFNAWLTGQESSGKRFTEEQRRWLEMVRDYIAANLGIEPDDFEYAPFSQHGGIGKVHQLFGDKLIAIIEELNETLAA